MKTSTLILSFCGFCIFYICNADWIDELYEKFVEGYFITDYEEVAPFVSSVTAGTEEFDKLLEELKQSKQQWYQFSPRALLSILFLTIFICLCFYIMISKGRRILKATQNFLKNFCRKKNSIVKNKKEFQDVGVVDIFKNKCKNDNGKKIKDDVPVKLLWKGGNLVESSIHCNIKDDSVDSKLLHMQKHLLQSKLLFQCSDTGGGDKKLQLPHVSSDESTALKIAEIRRLLESEPEIISRFVDLQESQNDCTRIKNNQETKKILKNNQNLASQQCFSSKRILGAREMEEKKILEPNCTELEENGRKHEEKFEDKVELTKIEEIEKETSEWDGSPDPRLMNRIRLLESRLRLEELKNKNWIKRMSRAEGILHQLNKQVDRGIDSMSKEANSSLLSGRAYRGGSAYGDADGNGKNHEHCDQLVSSTAEHSIHSGQSMPAVLLTAALHFFE